MFFRFALAVYLKLNQNVPVIQSITQWKINYPSYKVFAVQKNQMALSEQARRKERKYEQRTKILAKNSIF